MNESINEMNECISEAVCLANNYATFSYNAKRWLLEMDKLDKITKGLAVRTIISIAPPDIWGARNARFSIRPAELSGYADRISALGNNLVNAHSGSMRVFASIDSLIIGRLPAAYKGVAITGKILSLNQKSASIASRLKQICTVYQKADKLILSRTGGDVNGGTGTSDSSIKSGSKWSKAVLERLIAKLIAEGKIIGKKIDGIDSKTEKEIKKILGKCGIPGGLITTAWDIYRKRGDKIDAAITGAKDLNKVIKQVGEKCSKQVGDKIKVGTKWAGKLLDWAGDFYSNVKEQGGKINARAVTETVVENLVDFGLRKGAEVAVSAGLTAICTAVGVATPVGWVAAGSVAIVAGAKWAFKKATGKDLTETISDGIIDGTKAVASYAKKAAGKAAKEVGKGIKVAAKWLNKTVSKYTNGFAGGGGGGGAVTAW